jgi:hypothetical protein
VSSPTTVVSEILVELGDRLADEVELARALDRARDQHSLAPAGWVTTEGILASLRRRFLRATPPRTLQGWVAAIQQSLEADA